MTAIEAKIKALTEITGEAVLEKIGRFPEDPEDDQHCAFLAASAVQEALSQYMQQGVKGA